MQSASAVARAVHSARDTLTQRPSRNRAPLDGLRAIAVLLVIGFHCALFSRAIGEAAHLGVVRQVLVAGWSGVDVFFVLSGFLIGTIVLRRALDEGGGFGSFYLRRAFRIFPAYYTVLLASFLVLSRAPAFHGAFALRPRADMLPGTWSSFVYLSNYVYAREANWISWAWSLCIEEHFYLVLPLAVMAAVALHKGGRAILPALLLALPLPALFRAWAFWQSPEMIALDGPYYYTHTHSEGLLLGVLIAYLQLRHGEALRSFARRCGPALWIGAILGFLSLVLWGGLARPGAFPIVWQFAVAALASGMLLVHGLTREDAVTRALSHRAWYPIARVSYGMYLVHPFALAALMWGWPGGRSAIGGGVLQLATFTFAVAAVSFVVAAALFLALERPLLDLGARLTSRYEARSAAATTS